MCGSLRWNRDLALGPPSLSWEALRPSRLHLGGRILGLVFIRYYLELQLPFDEVERARSLPTQPRGCPAWPPKPRTRGSGRLLIEVGFEAGEDRRVDREVQIDVGEPVSVPSTTTKLPIAWKAKQGPRAFPQLDADIEIAALGAERTQLSMSARYRPPLGMIGRALDKALMHRVVEATVKDFLDRVGETGRPAGRRAPLIPEPMGSANQPPLRVLLVDDHEVVRSGVEGPPAGHGRHRGVRRGGDRSRGPSTRRTRPGRTWWSWTSVWPMGAGSRPPARSGRTAKTRVVMLTSFTDDEALFASIMARRPATCSSRSAGASSSGRSARSARASLLDPAVTNAVLERLRKGKHLLKDEGWPDCRLGRSGSLSLVADGKTNGEIDEELGLAEKTVKNVSSILSKLEVARPGRGYLARHTTTPGTQG